MVFVMVFICVAPQISNAQEMGDYANSVDDCYLSEIYIGNEGLSFIQKVVSISDYYYFDDENRLSISINADDLINEFHFSDEELLMLNSAILGKQFGGQKNIDSKIDCTELIQPQIHVSGGTLYISHNDLTVGVAAALVTAAQVGPAALAAALTALSTVVGGVAGSVIGLILSVAAAPSLVELAGRILYAVASKQGIYIKPVLSYPPLDIGYW